MWLQTLQQHAAATETGHSSPRYRVVIDTNVWVSGLLHGGNAEAVVRRVMSRHELVCSEYIVDELFDYLRELSPKVSRRWLSHLGLSMERFMVAVDSGDPVGIRDPKDEPVVALARETSAIIVTGDKDFLEHTGELGVTVLSVSEAVQLL